MDAEISALALTAAFFGLFPHDNRAGPLSAVCYDVLGKEMVVGQNNSNNRPVRAWPHSKLGGAGIDRCVAGTGTEEADDC